MNNTLSPTKRTLAASIVIAIGLLLTSCTTIYSPAVGKSGTMDLKEARKVLASEMKGGQNTSRVMDHTHYYQIKDVQVSLNRLVITGASDKVVFIFSELPAISMSSNMGLMYDKILLADRDTFYVEVEYPTSHRVMNALYALQQNAIKQKKEIAEYDARFAASLADYRNKAAANAALPEDANRYKVQAEGAVRDKEFNDAADYYAAALKIAQWWPVGHFNRALVLGETGDYDMAKREMNYYLQLVPNAPNARAAQDKIYDWARLDSK